MSAKFPERGTSAWRWLKSSHLQTRLLGLPTEIPWPGELPDPPADEPLRMEELLQAIPRAEADPAVTLDPMWSQLMPYLEMSAACKLSMVAKAHKAVEILLNKMDALWPCPAGLLLRAEWCYDRNNLKGAIRAFEQVTEQVPEYDIAWSSLGAIYSNSGDKEKAIRTYLKGWKACPSSEALAKRLVHYGKLYRFAGRPTKPGEALVNFVDADRYKQVVAWKLANEAGTMDELIKISTDIKNHAFDLEIEEQIYQTILAHDPIHQATRVRLAEVCLKTERLEQAESLLAQLGGSAESAELPADSEMLFQLHALAAKRGDKAAAVRWLEATLDADPNHTAAVTVKFAEISSFSTTEKRENLLMDFARERDSWAAAAQAHVLANKRRDFPRSAECGELAWKLNPDDETIFTRYTDDLLSIEEYEKLVVMLGPVYKAGKLHGSRKLPYAKALHCLGHQSDGLKILDEMLKDKRLSKVYLSNLQIQRDLWTGYFANPTAEYAVDYEAKTHHLMGAVVIIGINSTETPPVIVIPAGSRVPFLSEFPFDALPTGTTELCLEIGQQRKGIFKRMNRIGFFTVKGIEPKKLRSERLFWTLMYTGNGWVGVSCRQGKRKLKIEWKAPNL
jgi:tetratricopeptide (TPR) repeat protein